MQTYNAKPGEVEQQWFVIDATGKPLGRLASEIARRLRGKHKPQWTPHVDTGDHIVVINAEKVAVTGNKRTDKTYYRHSGYVGHLKETRFEEMIEKYPQRVIWLAVRGMMPRAPLGRAMLRKLHVSVGDDHKHQAQKPQPLEI